VKTQRESIAPADPSSAAQEAPRTSETAHQNQDQEYNQYEPESSATVVAGAIERAASDSAETSKQRDNDDDE
jgi:hypothetical protein